jgi:hypothetical protein
MTPHGGPKNTPKICFVPLPKNAGLPKSYLIAGNAGITCQVGKTAGNLRQLLV